MVKQGSSNLSVAYIIIGAGGAGKTTYVEKLKEKLKDFIIISRDLSRAKVLEERRVKKILRPQDIAEPPPSDIAKTINDVFHQSIREASDRGQNMIIERSHTHPKGRAETLKSIVGQYKKIAVVLETDINQSLQSILYRDVTRIQGSIPPGLTPFRVTRKAVEDYKEPTLAEGFDEIIFTRLKAQSAAKAESKRPTR